MKLKARMITGVFILIGVPCLVLGGISYLQTANSLEKAGQERVITAAEEMATALEASMEAAETLAFTAANDSVLQQAVLTGNGELARPVLKNLRQQNPELLDGVFIVNPAGSIVMSSQDNSAGISVKERDYFQKALRGEPGTSEVLISKTNQQSIIIIPRPMKKEGQVVGVLAASVNFDYLMRRITNIKIGENGFGYLVNKQGQLVYHPNREAILKDSLLKSKEEGVAALTQAMVDGKAGQGFYVEQGNKMLAAYVPMQQFSLAVTLPVKEYMKAADRILYNTLFILTGSLAIAMFIAYILAGSIVKPITRLRELMKEAEKGNLLVGEESERKDELGDLFRSFKRMLAGQGKVVRHVNDSSSRLLHSSKEMLYSTQQVAEAGSTITETMQDVAQDVQRGNEILQETSRSLLHLADLIQAAKEKVDVAGEKSLLTQKAGEAGRSKVDETVRYMQDIAEGTGRATTTISELNEYSQQAGQIIETITALASQTNLLALNASIEAARAGENGRGFSVVAEEVRKLAEQSNIGAQEISNLIHKITDKTKDVVIVNEGNAKRVLQGVSAAEAANHSLAQIVSAVGHTVTAVEEFSLLADEERKSSEEMVEQAQKLSLLMEQVAASSQHVAASMEEQAAALDTVENHALNNQEMAEKLGSVVSTFTI